MYPSLERACRRHLCSVPPGGERLHASLLRSIGPGSLQINGNGMAGLEESTTGCLAQICGCVYDGTSLEKVAECAPERREILIPSYHLLSEQVRSHRSAFPARIQEQSRQSARYSPATSLPHPSNGPGYSGRRCGSDVRSGKRPLPARSESIGIIARERFRACDSLRKGRCRCQVGEIGFAQRGQRRRTRPENVARCGGLAYERPCRGRWGERGSGRAYWTGRGRSAADKRRE